VKTPIGTFDRDHCTQYRRTGGIGHAAVNRTGGLSSPTARQGTETPRPPEASSSSTS
jgi:hypothetical protein